MEDLRDRWRRSLKGRAWLEVRRDGRTIRQTPVATNTITNLGLVFAFWDIWVGDAETADGVAPYLAQLKHNSYESINSVPSLDIALVYYDGTLYHAAWADPFALLYASTDATAPSSSTNALPGGTLIALGTRQSVVGDGISWDADNGQSVTGGGWGITAQTGTTPTVGSQSATSTLVTMPFVPYAGSGTVTVGSVGFTNGLYASTGITSNWTAINGAAMSLTGSTTPASTKNLSIGSKLIPSTTLSVTNGEQLVVNYEISFTPA